MLLSFILSGSVEGYLVCFHFLAIVRKSSNENDWASICGVGGGALGI